MALQFLREGLRSIRTVGTVTRSSNLLCAKVVSLAKLDGVSVVVELGAGDGVMTRHILGSLSPYTRLLAFEINPRFCTLLRTIADDRLIVVEASAETLPAYLAKAGIDEIDVVFSALPFVMLPDAVAQSIISDCHRLLKIGGQFLQIHYSLLAKELYRRIFGNLRITFYPFNIPPVFILECRR